MLGQDPVAHRFDISIAQLLMHEYNVHCSQKVSKNANLPELKSQCHDQINSVNKKVYCIVFNTIASNKSFPLDILEH